jgi:hypothetical protein
MLRCDILAFPIPVYYISNEMNTFLSLAVVGGGPNCLYLIERFAALLADRKLTLPLHLHIFEKSGFFGAGAVHSPTQPRSNLLNRIAGQVAFAPDESYPQAKKLLPKKLRPTLSEWAQKKFKETGDVRFDLKAEDWPPRYIHGLALIEHFDQYIKILQKNTDIKVFLHPCEVIGIRSSGEGYLLRAADSDEELFADEVMFMTGVSVNKPVPGSREEKLAFAGSEGRVNYIPYAYPLEKRIDRKIAGPNQIVGCVGMGQTGNDVILYLTEESGGRFLPSETGKGLTYLRSGKEPKKIACISQSGVFSMARPYNQKEQDVVALEHSGVFFHNQTIDRLRASVGFEREIKACGIQRQLNFECQVLPIILLEMECLYYKVLFGEKFGAELIELARPNFETFVSKRLPEHSSKSLAIDYLRKSILVKVDEAILAVSSFLNGERLSELESKHPNILPLLTSFLKVVFGNEFIHDLKLDLERRDEEALRSKIKSAKSPYWHSLDPQAHRFSWEKLISPISREKYSDPESYTKALLDYMFYDHRQAEQGNIDNPTKATCDGVWRDLRSSLDYLIDFGGLDGNSHRIFQNVYMRYHNRLGDGACLNIMEKMEALIRCGILDPSIGPSPEIKIEEDGVKLFGKVTGGVQRVDTLIEARLHGLDVRYDSAPVYRDLYNEGLIEAWVNPSQEGNDFVPGGISLTREYHPITKDGKINNRLSFIGAPSEGIMFFQVTLGRPHRNHQVLNEVINWVDRFLERYEEYSYKASRLTEKPAIRRSTSPVHSEVHG